MKFERELLKGVAPMVVLEILSRGAMYGYELSEAVSQRSGEVLSPGRGTLYSLLSNLEAKGRGSGEWQQNDGARKRRYYSITSEGTEHLQSQKDQWAQLQRGVNLALGFGGAGVVPA